MVEALVRLVVKQRRQGYLVVLSKWKRRLKMVKWRGSEVELDSPSKHQELDAA